MSVAERYHPIWTGLGVGMAVGGLINAEYIQSATGFGIALASLGIDIEYYFFRRPKNSDNIEEGPIPLDKIDNLNDRRRFMRPSDQEPDL